MDSFLDFDSKYFLLKSARQARKKDGKGDSNSKSNPFPSRAAGGDERWLLEISA
jgi:hypothetical protein